LNLPLRYPVTAFLVATIIFIISSHAVFGLQENINNSKLSFANGSAEESICPEQNCTMMHPSFEELIRWTELYANAPRVALEPRINQGGATDITACSARLKLRRVQLGSNYGVFS